MYVQYMYIPNFLTGLAIFLISHKVILIDIYLQAKGQFKRRSTANNVEIIIPVPADADTPKFRVSVEYIMYIMYMHV